MVTMYIPYSLIQVDIDVKKFIDHLKTLGFKYVFDTEIDGQKYAVVNYANISSFMVEYKGKEVKDAIEGTRTQKFHILEVDGNMIYEVSWDESDGVDNVIKQEETFDNYFDAFHQYEHLGKLDVKATLKLRLLPLPTLKGGN